MYVFPEISRAVFSIQLVSSVEVVLYHFTHSNRRSGRIWYELPRPISISRKATPPPLSEQTRVGRVRARLVVNSQALKSMVSMLVRAK